MLRGIFAALTLLLVSYQGVARGQEPSDEAARFHFKAGKSYFDTGDYELALREFERAYELSQRPQLHYNISVAHEKLGNLEKAIPALEKYLAEAPDVPNRQTLELRLENMKKRLEKRQEAAADEKAAAPVPVPVPTGEQAEAPSEPLEPAAEPPPEAGPEPQPVSEEGQTEEPAPQEEPSDEAASGGLPTGALVAFIAGGVGAAMFVGFGTAALIKDGSLSDECLDDNDRPTCDSDEVSGLTTFALLADLGLAVAVVGGVVGTVLLLSGGDEQELSAKAAKAGKASNAARKQAAVVPWLGPGQAGAAARVSF